MKNKIALNKFCFTLEAINTIHLPVYKGSTFHGGFGHALRKISPIWYRYFFEFSYNPNWPKAYILLPPFDELAYYPKGHKFHLELTLIGEAIQDASIVQVAIEYLGLQMSLGSGQGYYKIIAIEKSQPDFNPPMPADFITLYFPTHLRLKKNNKLYKQSPDFQLLITRLLGRIKTLQQAYMGVTSDRDYFHYLITKAQEVKISKSDMQWQDWTRFSGRQKQWMKFGGLKGNIRYSGDLEPFMEILTLGEWLHIGNKTSFGLGKY